MAAGLTLTQLAQQRKNRQSKIPSLAKRAPLRPRGLRRTTVGLSLYEFLAMDEFAQGTSLERVVDGAARQLGIVWTGIQYKIPLTFSGRYTVPDRMLGTLCVYIDGPQHYLRPEQVMTDMMQQVELESMGYEVVRLLYSDLIADPLNTVRRMLLLRSFYGGY